METSRNFPYCAARAQGTIRGRRFCGHFCAGANFYPFRWSGQKCSAWLTVAIIALALVSVEIWASYRQSWGWGCNEDSAPLFLSPSLSVSEVIWTRVFDFQLCLSALQSEGNALNFWLIISELFVATVARDLYLCFSLLG